MHSSIFITVSVILTFVRKSVVNVSIPVKLTIIPGSLRPYIYTLVALAHLLSKKQFCISGYEMISKYESTK